MKLLHLYGAITLIISITSAVFVQDAFVKDWINYHYGQLEKYDVVSNGTLIGITDFNQLINLNLNDDATIRWSVDLRQYPQQIDDYILVNHGNFIYGYSKSNNEIYLWQTKTGILIESFQLESVPLKFEPFYNLGLLVLELNGDIQLLHKDGSIISIVYKQDIKDFRVGKYNENGYVITDDDSIVAVDVNQITKLITASGPTFNKIKSFKDNVIITSDNKLFDLDDLTSPISIPFKLNDVLIVNSDYFADYTSKLVTLYKRDTKGNVEKVWTRAFDQAITKVEVFDYSLSNLLIVSSLSDVHSIDITDFLSTDDAETINIISYPIQANENNRIIFNSIDKSLELISAEINDFKLELFKYSLQSEGKSSYLSLKLDDFHLSSTPKVILVNKPQSQKVIDKAHHLIEDAYSLNIVTNWLSRSKRHLAEFGRYVISTFKDVKSDAELVGAKEDTYGFEKMLIYIDEEKHTVIALDSSTSEKLWTSTFPFNGKVKDLKYSNSYVYVVFTDSIVKIDPINENSISAEFYDHEISKVFNVKLDIDQNNDETETLAIQFRDSLDLVYVEENNLKVKLDQYIIEEVDNKIQGLKINDKKLVPTWIFSKFQESIVSITSKPKDTITSSIAISRFDKSVIYKYLYPNLISVLTQNEITNQIKLYIIDGITGNLLYTHSHDNEVVDSSSINLIEDDNWIIYSYYIKSPKLEQRIVVIDLFDTAENAISNDKEISIFDDRFNSTINSISKKSFIFPERIISMAPTQTKFGITLKSIIAITETGSLIEIPKFILNSRRIDDREIKQEDYQDEFRIMPYEPVIFKNTYQILNHKQKLTIDENDKENKILIKPTELESTLVVCSINKFSEFCTLIQPSLSYDLLNTNFDKVKLILTILILFIGYFITKPMVRSKKLNASWIDH